MELTYKQARDRLKDITDELERLDAKADQADNGILSDEDQTYFDDLDREADEVAAFIKRCERQSSVLRVKRHSVGSAARNVAVERGTDDLDSDPLGEPDSIERGIFMNPWDTSQIRMGLGAEERGTELRARAISAIARMQGTTDSRREAATKIIERFDTEDGAISNQVLATSSPEYLRAFGKLAKNGGRTEVLNQVEKDAVQRAMSLTDTEGGFLVPFQLDPTVIISSDGSYNEIRQIARKVVATGDVWNGVSAGAVAWSFDAEAAAVSDDAPTFASPAITIRTARGFVPISLEARMDAANVAAEVGTLLAAGKDDLEAVKFITGAAGSNEPIGLITALTGTASVVASSTTDAFLLADIYKVYNALPARHRMRSRWLANNLIYSLSRNFDTAGGAGLWAQLGEGRPGELIGRPVHEAEEMDGVITALADNLSLVIGDFQHYVIADRLGVVVDFIPHLFDTSTGRPTGQSGWFAHYRCGADSVLDGAFRVLNIT